MGPVAASLPERVARLGEEGWELVAVAQFAGDPYQRWPFKRRKQPHAGGLYIETAKDDGKD